MPWLLEQESLTGLANSRHALSLEAGSPRPGPGGVSVGSWLPCPHKAKGEEGSQGPVTGADPLLEGSAPRTRPSHRPTYSGITWGLGLNTCFGRTHPSPEQRKR